MRRIPRHLLHITLDDLPAQVRSRVLPLIADLPRVPTAADSALLIGPSATTLPALAVVARHVVQGLRDHNLSLAHDRDRLRLERRKLLFVDPAGVDSDPGVRDVCVLCLVDADAAMEPLLAARRAAGLASFVTAPVPLPFASDWRVVDVS